MYSPTRDVDFKTRTPAPSPKATVLLCSSPTTRSGGSNEASVSSRVLKANVGEAVNETRSLKVRVTMGCRKGEYFSWKFDFPSTPPRTAKVTGDDPPCRATLAAE